MKKRFTKKPINASEVRDLMKYVLITASFDGGEGSGKRALRVIDKASIALQEAGYCTEYEANKTTGDMCVNGFYLPALEKLASNVSWIQDEIDDGLTREQLGQMYEDDVQSFYKPYVDTYSIDFITKQQYDELDKDEDGYVIEPEYEYDEEGWSDDYEEY